MAARELSIPKSIKEDALRLMRDQKFENLGQAAITDVKWTELLGLAVTLLRSKSLSSVGLNEGEVIAFVKKLIADGKTAYLIKAIVFAVKVSTRLEKMAYTNWSGELKDIITHTGLGTIGSKVNAGKILAVWPQYAIYLDPLQADGEGIPRIAKGLSTGVFISATSDNYDIWAIFCENECMRIKGSYNTDDKTIAKEKRSQGTALFGRIQATNKIKRGSMEKNILADCDEIITRVFNHYWESMKAFLSSYKFIDYEGDGPAKVKEDYKFTVPGYVFGVVEPAPASKKKDKTGSDSETDPVRKRGAKPKPEAKEKKGKN